MAIKICSVQHTNGRASGSMTGRPMNSFTRSGKCPGGKRSRFAELIDSIGAPAESRDICEPIVCLCGDSRRNCQIQGAIAFSNEQPGRIFFVEEERRTRAHAATRTVSKARHKKALSRKRPCRFFEKSTGWANRRPNRADRAICRPSSDGLLAQASLKRMPQQ
jgi:hypothetical protein